MQYSDQKTDPVRFDIEYNKENKKYRTEALSPAMEYKGYISYGVSPKSSTTGYIYKLDVAEQFRNNGLGTQLTEHAFAMLEDQGFKKICWEAVPENITKLNSLIKFYKKLGAREIKPQQNSSKKRVSALMEYKTNVNSKNKKLKLDN